MNASFTTKLTYLESMMKIIVSFLWEPFVLWILTGFFFGWFLVSFLRHWAVCSKSDRLYILSDTDPITNQRTGETFSAAKIIKGRSLFLSIRVRENQNIHCFLFFLLSSSTCGEEIFV